ncbi:M15 family metallopeptidase [Anaerocolumna sp.]|uniref:M15 family metallopeptidase n=1 Tax=Anaerocolumna sp. TaxID=2041569 RepID=UPI0028A8AFBE|nr:M15 family metallopeptidase [Anaerocolumna sp.]
MRRITLNESDIFHGPLILVNKEHQLQYKSDPNLVPYSLEYKEIQLDAKTASMLSKLLESIQCDDEIIPVSGYRSKEEQEEIFENSLLENGLEFTHKYVAFPDHSEHQTGLAIDLGENCESIDFIRPEFPYSGICGEFRAKAPQYGFIERYGKGKETMTGIAHEPWHFRYVGYPHSYLIEYNGLSLEEYIQFVKAYSYQGEHLTIKHKGTEVKVFFVESKGDQTVIELSNSDLYQVSGNNVDGFIVTVWRQYS